MPCISFLYRIAIMIYFWDREPPQFHAQHAQHHAVIAIANGEVFAGGLPARAPKLVSESAGPRIEELELDWEMRRCRRHT